MNLPVDIDQTLAPPPPIYRLLRPFQEFARIQAAGGIVLLLATFVALVWANTPGAAVYHDLLHQEGVIGLGGFVIREPVLHWINDGLMAIFFFVVGLEIKRELLPGGELSSPKKAALPVAAALGGMAAPAVVYALLNSGKPGAAGWGIPMATDIAFALGILALLGDRVPTPLKVFLAAFAIVDDIGAVLVIALFYTPQVQLLSLLIGIAILGLSVAANLSGIRHPLVYALLGGAVWLAFFKSGIHATVAGVLLAFTIPAHARLNAHQFQQAGRALLDRFESDEQQATLHTLEIACERVQTPLQRMENALHPWVSFFIVPVFALANAGTALSGNTLRHFGEPVPLGILLGLFLGKPLGITLFSWVAVRTRLAVKPDGMTWAQLHGAGWLGGIGFTMALFIAGLAFTNQEALDNAKLGIFSASLLAGITGTLLVRRSLRVS